MDIPSLIVVFLCSWWVALFTTLPLWIKRDEGGPEVTAPGAPEHPHLKKKFLITSVIACIITGVIYGFVVSDIVSFRQQANEMAIKDYKG